jgi:predicted flap endonuclease-1-like 5' DNA nuclease
MLTTSPDINTIGIVVGAAIVLLLLLGLLLGRTRKGRIEGQEGDGVADGAAAAIEDTLGELLGVDAHPDAPPPLPEATGDPDVLTTLKGLGPKAAAQLNALGITRFDQLAALTPAQQSAIDDRMGNFKGRLYKDRWTEQAAFLAKDDRAGFEAQFGKLG